MGLSGPGVRCGTVGLMRATTALRVALVVAMRVALVIALVVAL